MFLHIDSYKYLYEYIMTPILMLHVEIQECLRKLHMCQNSMSLQTRVIAQQNVYICICQSITFLLDSETCSFFLHLV